MEIANLEELAKAVLLRELEKLPEGHVYLDVPCEGPENTRIFMRALNSIEVTREFDRRGVQAEIREINPLDQVRKYMLTVLRQITPGNPNPIIFQCYLRDADLYHKALNSLEVQTLLQRRNIQAEIREINSRGGFLPQIVIATVEDVASGKLDSYWRKE